MKLDNVVLDEGSARAIAEACASLGIVGTKRELIETLAKLMYVNGRIDGIARAGAATDAAFAAVDASLTHRDGRS